MPTPRTREQLAAHLDDLGLRADTYDLHGGHPPGGVVLGRRRGRWVVFEVGDRGDEHVTRSYWREASACADLLERVHERLRHSDHAFFDLVVGPAPADVADQAFDDWLSAHGTSRDQLSTTDWKQDDVPWGEGDRWRRYFLRITTARRLTGRA